MATVVSSPFQCGGTAKRLPAGTFRSLILRVNDVAATARVIIKIDRTIDVTSANAEFFLNAGEALELDNVDLSDVTILDVSDNPLIYFKGF
jgi:hypothetical protein